jgi:hypothetical protein
MEKGEMMREYIVREIDCGLATKQESVGELVRCKDCKFYRFYDGTFGKGWMCFENNTARHGDDFCSRGEREDNADK